jgi:phage/plasmid primase-like uncharacterized protein
MDFASFAISVGLVIHDFSHSSRIRRCGTALHPKSKNGAYYFDGVKGWCQNWEMSGQPHWWQSDRELNPLEREQWRKRAEEWKEQRRKLSSWAASKAQERLDTAHHGFHPYMESKGIGNTYVMIEDVTRSLLIPMRNARDNSLLGLQEIYYDHFNCKWLKKMQYGMSAKGAVFKVSPEKPVHGIYCEGFATGISIVQAARVMKLPVNVTICFSADNMLHVARYFGDVDHSIIFADNDKSGKGQQVAAASGFVWTMPETEGQDANDLFREQGPLAVLQLMIAAFKERDRVYGKKRLQKREAAG